MTTVLPSREETIRNIIVEALRFKGVKVYELAVSVEGWAFVSGTLKTESITIDSLINKPGAHGYSDIVDAVLARFTVDELHNPRQVARFRNEVPTGVRMALGPELTRLKIDFFGIRTIKSLLVKDIEEHPLALVEKYADLVNRGKLTSRVSGVSELLEDVDYNRLTVAQRCLLNFVHDTNRMF